MSHEIKGTYNDSVRVTVSALPDEFLIASVDHGRLQIASLDRQGVRDLITVLEYVLEYGDE